MSGRQSESQWALANTCFELGMRRENDGPVFHQKVVETANVALGLAFQAAFATKLLVPKRRNLQRAYSATFAPAATFLCDTSPACMSIVW